MNASNLPFSLVNVEAMDAADDFPVNDLFRTNIAVMHRHPTRIYQHIG
jgi:hypothetical protein